MSWDSSREARNRIRWTPDVTSHSPPRDRLNSLSSQIAKRLSSGSSKTFRAPGHVHKSNNIPTAGTKTGMAGMLDIDRTHPRRERTFAGGECVVCEEPLEHTLRGERILQLSCAHVSHEACFYEFIRESDSQACPSCNAPLGLDANRGGNVLDIEKLSTIVRSLVVNDSRQNSRSNQATPIPWDGQGYPPQQQQQQQQPQHHHPQDVGYDHHGHAHARNGSAGTVHSGGESGVSHSMSMRRHDYDVHSMEADTMSARSHRAKNPIPTPSVLIRSEYPTLTRSKQPQNLTCLVTVEMPEGKWQPDIEDLKNMRPGLNETVERTHQKGQSSSSNKIPKPPQQGSHQQIQTKESNEELERVTENLYARVDNWHGLDFSRFGRLLLHDTVRVGKDRQSWQELECYLFAEMLICVKEKKNVQVPADGDRPATSRNKCVLKGSIMIKKHLEQIETSTEASNILTLNLTVPELPTFHLYFRTQRQLETWKDAFIALNHNDSLEKASEYDQDVSEADEDEERRHQRGDSSTDSYARNNGSYQTPVTDYSDAKAAGQGQKLPISLHVPLDIVLVIPMSSNMISLKVNIVRDLLRFMAQSLGGRDRMGLISFGSSNGAVPLVGMTNKSWAGWNKVIESIKPSGQKGGKADPVDGASAAMDLLMQRKSTNPLSSILIVSDSAFSENEGIDFVVSRAEAAKVSIYSFGMGTAHKPDAMIELSTRTKAAYTYVKDWMMLRECISGCMGSLQSICHQNVVLKLKLPEGSPGRFLKISGALQITKRASGRDAEAALGDFRFGEKRDVLVQLAISPENSTPDGAPQDAWETIVSGLEALGGPSDQEDSRTSSVEEVPILQAGLAYGDVLREGATTPSSRPSLLTITMLPASQKTKSTNGKPGAPPIPPHPFIVQRRMELLTSDMLTRALTLVGRGQHERAHDTLRETRSILKGLGKGGLPPVPQHPATRTTAPQTPATPSVTGHSPAASETTERNTTRAPSPPAGNMSNTSGIDHNLMMALDAELESSLEWINHPAIFSRDSRKAVLEKIGVISSQRAYTTRTALENLYASKIPGIRALLEESRNWPEPIDESLSEEMT